jgi:uncharacterized membrane protein
MRALRTIVVVLLVAIGVLAAIGYFHHPLFNPRFAEFPRLTRLHVVFGGLYLALAPFQFLTARRPGALDYHRVAGRILVPVALVVGATATFITFVIPNGGWHERVLVGPFAVFFLVALVVAVRRIRAGRVAEHREWMIRAFAIALAIASQRVLFVLEAVAIYGRRPVGQEIHFLAVSSFTIAFGLHALLAERMIRAGRRRPTVAPAPALAGA